MNDHESQAYDATLKAGGNYAYQLGWLEAMIEHETTTLADLRSAVAGQTRAREELAL